MWAKIAAGCMISYGLAKANSWYTDDVLVEESSKYNSIFALANRLEKLSGGKAYVGLRIPDANTMWAKIAAGCVISYGLAKAYNRYTDTDTDDDSSRNNSPVEESSKYNSLFAVANRLEKLYGGKAYVGLRIPDADTVSGHTIDIVLVTEGKAVVISVKDIFGIAFVSSESTWNIISDPVKGIPECIPDPVVETKRKASILESYFDLRGVALPEGYFSCYVVLPKIFRFDGLPSEVIDHDRWQQKSMFSGCAEGAFRGREEKQGSIHQKFDFILSTAPMWDRLELKGNKYVLGEFLDFVGIREGIQAYLMKKIKRSTVSHLLIVQKTSEEGSMVKILYSRRDYQSEEGSASKREEITVSSSIQVLFRPQNWANKLCRLELSRLVSLSLST